MSDFNKSLKTVALTILRRELKEEERMEFLELGAALGMNNVEDYLYILMIFKRHSDIMEKKFDELSALERRISDTLEYSIHKILGEGAARIGTGMGETIAERSKELMTSVKEFYTLRGSIVAITVTGLLAAMAYWLGISGVVIMDEIDLSFRSVFYLQAGYWMFLSMSMYTYCWCCDNWNLVKYSPLYKCILALLGVITAIVLLKML